MSYSTVPDFEDNSSPCSGVLIVIEILELSRLELFLNTPLLVCLTCPDEVYTFSVCIVLCSVVCSVLCSVVCSVYCVVSSV